MADRERLARLVACLQEQLIWIEDTLVEKGYEFIDPLSHKAAIDLLRHYQAEWGALKDAGR